MKNPPKNKNNNNNNSIMANKIRQQLYNDKQIKQRKSSPSTGNNVKNLLNTIGNKVELSASSSDKKLTSKDKQENLMTKSNVRNDANINKKKQQQPKNWNRESSSPSSGLQQDANTANQNKLFTTNVKVQSNLFTPKPFVINYSATKKNICINKFHDEDFADSNEIEESLATVIECQPPYQQQSQRQQHCKPEQTEQHDHRQQQEHQQHQQQQHHHQQYRQQQQQSPALFMGSSCGPSQSTPIFGTPCTKCTTQSDTFYKMLTTPTDLYRREKFKDSLSKYRNSNRRYCRYLNDRLENERHQDLNLATQSVMVKPVWSGSNIICAITDIHTLTLIERIGKFRRSFPLMQCGTLEEEEEATAADTAYHQQRAQRMDVFQIDDGFHSDSGTETPPPSSPSSSGSSIVSTSDHGSLDSVDTGGAQRLAVLSFEQVRKLNDVMDDTVYIHGRGNFPTLEVKLKDLVNLVRRKLEADIGSGGAGVIVKDVRLNGGAASHVLASEDQPYNDLDLIYAIELTSSRHFDRVKNAVLNTLLDLLPEGTSKHRIMPCALKEAYVGKMVKVNNNNDGDRWSLISLGSKRGHKNVELKFVDTMRRQFEFSVDSFQIVLDSLLLFYDCAALPISENFYPTVVGESVYGDFQEAMYHLQKKLISTRQPEEIRGGGLLKYCNLLVRNYTPIDPQHIKTLERYMCSRFFIDFPDIGTQTLKLDGYLADHFCGIDEEPLQYQYLMHLREVVEMSTVCLMGHERRQTLLLIQYLAAQVLYKEHQRQQAQALELYEHQQQQQQQQQHQQPQLIQQQKQQSQQPVASELQTQSPQTYVTQTQQQHQQQIVDIQQQSQPMYVQQQQQQQQRTVKILEQIQQQQQLLLNTTSNGPPPQTIHIPSGPLGLIYANGVYYAPVIPTTICTCNSTWVST